MLIATSRRVVMYKSSTVRYCLPHHLKTVFKTSMKLLMELRSMLLFPGVQHYFDETHFSTLLKLS